MCLSKDVHTVYVCKTVVSLGQKDLRHAVWCESLDQRILFFLSVSLSRVAGGPVGFLSEPRLQVPQTLRKEVKGNGF